MHKSLSAAFLILGLAASLKAEEIQGVIADWKCVKPMVQNGRAKTLKSQTSCSLMKNNAKRPAYGLITQDKKAYKLDDPGNGKILQLLRDTPDRDDLHVIVTGNVQGDVLKVATISLL